MNKNLTIAIPTINRPLLIKKLLINLHTQIKNYNLFDSTEIVVSDNSSNKETEIIVNDLNKSFDLKIFYTKNININKSKSQAHSFDSNVDNLFKNSNSKYIWVVGDDDFISDNAIFIINKIIQDNNYTFTNIYIDSLKPFTDIPNDIITDNKNEFCKITEFRSGGITANVFNRELWLKNISELDYGSGWIHIIYLIKNLGKEKSYIYRDSLKDEYINFDKYKNDKKYKKVFNNNYYFLAFLNNLELLYSMKNFNFDEKIVDYAFSLQYKNFTYRILSFKFKGLEINLKLLKKFLIATRNLGIFKYYYLFVLILVPKWILKLIKR